MRVLLVSLTTAALLGCASAPVAVSPRSLFADSLFAEAPRPPVGEDPFTLSEDMVRFAATGMAATIRRHGLQDGIAAAVKDELRLEYDATETLPAAQTFARRSGNCLSLVILTAAFARHLDVPVTFQNVYGQEAWSRSDGILFFSTHVNARLGLRGLPGPVIDFVDPGRGRLQQVTTRLVDEAELRAMYFNNRAAEALVDGDVGTAYWWARAAIDTAPSYANGVNTLAVVYLRHGRLREAERALRYVLEREPDNGRAMTNLIGVLSRDGRPEEAAEWQRRLAAIEPYPPFYFLDQGLAALSDGRNEAARELLNKELRRMPYYDEVHFALAVADLRLGDIREARSHLGLALKYSTTRDRRSIYGAKLSRLKALEASN
ncbi:MAG: tetratricopeptide repeat protein [Nevskiaceae bacterium]